eukprot:223871_1
MASEDPSTGSAFSVPDPFHVFEPEGPTGAGPGFGPTCKLEKSRKERVKFKTIKPDEAYLFMFKRDLKDVEAAWHAAEYMKDTQRGSHSHSDRPELSEDVDIDTKHAHATARTQDFDWYNDESYHDESNMIEDLDEYIYDLAVDELIIDSRLKRLQRKRQNILKNKRKRKQN